MKKIFVTFATLAMIGVAETNAQLKFAFSKGVGVNAVMSDFTLADKNKSGFGASLSSSDKLEIGEHVALQSELHLHYSASQSVKYWGLEVPIYVVGHLKIGAGKGFLGVGSYTDYGFRSKKWNTGGAVIAGYEFSNGFFVNISCKRRFFEWMPTHSTNVATMLQMVGIGVGYRFPLFAVNMNENIHFSRK
ncbi:MAG: porin family protein [Bacteroidales bacterium]|nr:porin family protein [Bacteroidales bacterium]